MTIIVSVPSQQYTPRVFRPSFAIPAGTKVIVATLTRESWPAGNVVSISIDFPDGTLAAGVSIPGGVQTNRDGSVTLKSGVQLGTAGGPDLPVGTWGATVTVLQTITTAVSVERF